MIAKLRSPQIFIIKMLFALLLAPAASLAQSQLAQNIPAKDNPRFLPHFLERFSDGFRAQTHFAQPEMPAKLREFWRENMSEPRDFAEEVAPGVKWPRFQWGIQSVASSTGPGPSEKRYTLPVYQWFDIKNSERLVHEWNKAFCFDKETGWIGVSWAGDRSQYEFFFKDGRVRRYKNEKFSDEYRIEFKSDSGVATATATNLKGETLFVQSSVGRIPPQLKNPQAAHLQLNIQREFLIFPRTYARAEAENWERVFFP